MKNLYFGVLVAPYRVDYYNYLHDSLNYELWFQQDCFGGQLFDSKECLSQCHFPSRIIPTKRIGQRKIAVGLRKLIFENSPSTVIVPEFSFIAIQVILFKLLFKCKFRIISQCDDNIHMLKSKGFSYLHCISRRICIPFFDNLILLDSRVVDWYQAHYRKGFHVPMIQNESVALANIDKIKSMSNSVISQFNPTHLFQILFVARHIELKNFPILVDACAELDIPYRLIVVGDGPMNETWKNYADMKAINSIFVGKQSGDSLKAFYYTSDIFVLPSTLEPFGAVTNEALLFGCKCLVSEKAGSSILIESGINGYTFNPYDQKDLASKILLLHSSTRNTQKQSLMSISFLDAIQVLETHLK